MQIAQIFLFLFQSYAFIKCHLTVISAKTKPTRRLQDVCLEDVHIFKS